MEKLENTKILEENSTLIVSSLESGESVCFRMIDSQPYFNICRSIDKNYVMDLCKKNYYPLDYKNELKNLSWHWIDGPYRRVVVIPHNSNIDLGGICVEEVTKNGNKPKLMVSHIKIKNIEQYLKKTEDKEMEL